MLLGLVWEEPNYKRMVCKECEDEKYLHIEYTIYNLKHVGIHYCIHSTLPVAVEEKSCPVFLQKVWVEPKSM